MLLVNLVAVAMAGEVEVWSYDFQNAEQLAGTDGWENGYRDDPWYGYEGQQHNYAGPYTDDGSSCDNGWANDCNNYLVNEASEVHNGRYQVGLYSNDDDTVGVTFGFKAANDYLLFVVCGIGNQSSCPLSDAQGQAAILHISGQSAEVLATGSGEYNQGDFTEFFEVSVKDGEITATVAGGRPVTATMPDDRPMTGIGFYAYNSGAAQATVLFYEPTLYAFDTDDDGVIDDEDNCVDVANPDQTDADGDGKGAECDDNDGGGGGGDDTGNGGDDSGNGNNGDDSGNGGDDSGDAGGNGSGAEGLTAPGACACSSGGDASFGAVLLGGLVLAAARRKRTE